MKDNEIWEIINEQNELEHCPGVMSGESSEAERENPDSIQWSPLTEKKML